LFFTFPIGFRNDGEKRNVSKVIVSPIVILSDISIMRSGSGDGEVLELGESDEEGDRLALALELGESEDEGDSDRDTDEEGESDLDTDEEGERLALALELGDSDLDTDEEGERLALALELGDSDLDTDEEGERL
jgi:hypothetical protein